MFALKIRVSFFRPKKMSDFCTEKSEVFFFGKKTSRIFALKIRVFFFRQKEISQIFTLKSEFFCNVVKQVT